MCLLLLQPPSHPHPHTPTHTLNTAHARQVKVCFKRLVNATQGCLLELDSLAVTTCMRAFAKLGGLDRGLQVGACGTRVGRARAAARVLCRAVPRQLHCC
jgi:hypothetical protein